MEGIHCNLDFTFPTTIVPDICVFHFSEDNFFSFIFQMVLSGTHPDYSMKLFFK